MSRPMKMGYTKYVPESREFKVRSSKDIAKEELMKTPKVRIIPLSKKDNNQSNSRGDQDVAPSAIDLSLKVIFNSYLISLDLI